MPGVCLCHKEIDRFPSSSTAPKSEILGELVVEGNSAHCEKAVESVSHEEIFFYTEIGVKLACTSTGDKLLGLSFFMPEVFIHY